MALLNLSVIRPASVQISKGFLLYYLSNYDVIAAFPVRDQRAKQESVIWRNDNKKEAEMKFPLKAKPLFPKSLVCVIDWSNDPLTDWYEVL